jgi:hypothetical protein
VDGWEQRVREAVGGVDVVFDGVGERLGARRSSCWSATAGC